MYTSPRFSPWALLLILVCSQAADAQGILGRVRDAAQRGAERAAEREAERRADAAVTNAIQCTLGDAACAEDARASGQEVVYVDDQGNPVEADAAAPGDAAASGTASGNTETLRPGEGVWANYDFVPGERPLFIDDFSGDRVGNFPRRLEFREGNFEVVEWQGQRLLRSSAQGAFGIPLPETLPERFTIEFDAHNPDGEWLAVMTSDEGFQGGALNYSNFPGSFFLSDGPEAGLDGEGPDSKTATTAVREGLTPVRITVDGSYAKMYIGEQRVANVPNANIIRGNKLHVITWYARPDRPTYIGNIRVMAGGRELYDALTAEGRVATQGILFDSGSDVIKPESTPTLVEIGDMLKNHSDLRLAIEGHTDDQGDDTANQSLSERRAAAVKAYLVSAYGIDAARLEAQGLGETQPAADNGTLEGRQQNRRVELVRL